MWFFDYQECLEGCFLLGGGLIIRDAVKLLLNLIKDFGVGKCRILDRQTP